MNVFVPAVCFFCLLGICTKSEMETLIQSAADSNAPIDALEHRVGVAPAILAAGREEVLAKFSEGDVILNFQQENERALTITEDESIEGIAMWPVQETAVSIHVLGIIYRSQEDGELRAEYIEADILPP